MKTNLILPISIIITGIIIAGTIFYVGSRSNTQGNIVQGAPSPPENIGRKVEVAIVDSDPLLGDNNAPVTFIAFEDFECPFCERFSQQTLPLIINEFVKSGKVRIVWKDFPLSIHSRAQEAHEAARCAWEQDKFWEYHDVIYDNQNNLGTNDLKRHAKNLGLNESQFSSCFDSGKYTDLIKEKVSEGTSIGVSGTPSFLINGRLVVGAQPYQTFADIINQIIQ